MGTYLNKNKTYEDYLGTYYQDNFKWKLEDIAKQYKYENPDWKWKQCWEKAKVTYGELKRINRKMWNDNKTYYKFFKPFTFYESFDGEWSSIPELEEI